MMNKLTLKRAPTTKSTDAKPEAASGPKRPRVAPQAYKDLGKVMAWLRQNGYSVRWFRPMSKQMYNQIKAALPEGYLSARRLYDALGWHCRSVNYLTKLKAGDSRWNVQGKREGKVTSDEAEFAIKQLYEHHGAAMRSRRKNKGKIIVNTRAGKGKPPRGDK